MLNTDLTSMLSRDDLSVLFDRHWYRVQNADVIDAGADPLEHYIAVGSLEGRDPHPLFDTSWYLERNPDVAEAGVNPLAHYIAYGAGEGRDPHPLFDTSWYLEQNPDVAGADKNPLAHYISYGAGESRNPHPLFNASWYFHKYPDVAAAKENPLSHYVHVGVHYGTEPHPFFNGAWYKRAHLLPDLVGIGPLVHFIESGGDADLDPSPYFSTSWYRRRYLSDYPRHTNPLVHFICEGRASGYSPLPIEMLHRFRIWEENKDFLDDAEDVRRHLSTMVVRPHFYVYINSASNNCFAIASVENQIYKNYTMIDNDEWSNINEGRIRLSDGSYLIWLEADDRLHQKALYWFASAVNQYGDADVFYGDEEIDASDGRSTVPFYKPRWSPSYLECFDYIGRAACYNVDLLSQSLPQTNTCYALCLELTARSSSIIHIRKNIVKSDDRRSTSDQYTRKYKNLLEENFRSTGRIGNVRQRDARHNNFYFEPAHPDFGSLSIVLYSADHAPPEEGKIARALQWLLPELSGIIPEIIIINEYLENDNIILDRVSIECNKNGIYDVSSMNWSKFIDDTTRVNGQSILFVDIDACLTSSDWAKNLFRHFLSPKVAAVGAEVNCASSNNRYSGIIFRNSAPRYVRTIPCDMQDEYFFSQSSAKNYQAVSPAFMLVRADIYTQIKKQQPTLEVQFSLIDYCLRCVATEHTIVHEPMVQIDYTGTDLQQLLDESNARDAFYSVWGTQNFSDPYYNENFLSITPPHYEGRVDLDRCGDLDLR